MNNMNRHKIDNTVLLCGTVFSARTFTKLGAQLYKQHSIVDLFARCITLLMYIKSCCCFFFISEDNSSGNLQIINE